MVRLVIYFDTSDIVASNQQNDLSYQNQPISQCAAVGALGVAPSRFNENAVRSRKKQMREILMLKNSGTTHRCHKKEHPQNPNAGKMSIQKKKKALQS